MLWSSTVLHCMHTLFSVHWCRFRVVWVFKPALNHCTVAPRLTKWFHKVLSLLELSVSHPLSVSPWRLCIYNKRASCHICLRSNTSMPVVWAWRRRSWKRVQTCSLCATPCLCTPRPQTSSSGSLSSHRMLRVSLSNSNNKHTYTYTEGSNNFTQKCLWLLSESSTAFSNCNYSLCN